MEPDNIVLSEISQAQRKTNISHCTDTWNLKADLRAVESRTGVTRAWEGCGRVMDGAQRCSWITGITPRAL